MIGGMPAPSAPSSPVMVTWVGLLVWKPPTEMVMLKSLGL